MAAARHESRSRDTVRFVNLLLSIWFWGLLALNCVVLFPIPVASFAGRSPEELAAGVRTLMAAELSGVAPPADALRV